ncbi:TadA family conjugal transfer-associated ATPase [Actinotalea subterranea]|uniref:TadA family conjugal transfer-associated ATPase n=1 Tax=Actinotalea subterranea TaxID=2607497 RepID=UPI001FECA4B6|nr:TadA family conjugal transfer-associated ATPase [Actinotalea subterranea]
MTAVRPEGSAAAHAPVRVAPVLLDEVRRRTASGEALPGRDALARMVRDLGGVLGREDLEALATSVRAEVQGAGPLQPLLESPGVTDVLVNGPGDVWVDRGAGLERVDVDVGDAAQVRALAVRLASAGGQRLDDAVPVVDARLPDGTRLHAVLPPVAPGCTVLSLRVHRDVAYTLDELVTGGTVAAPMALVLRGLVAGRANLVVSGATGTGKTTLLSTLLSLVPRTERIVCIEEAGELAPDHPHVVRLLARRPNVEGAGGVDLATLVRQALRMRPDRIVLGECRGAEVREVLTALNTGHEGGCATLHANRVEDVPARLEALGSLAGMSREALAAQAVSALDAVVHLRRDAGVRYVAQVGAVGRDPDGGGLVVRAVLEVGAGGDVRPGPGWPAFAARWGPGRVPLPGGPGESAWMTAGGRA